MMELIKQTLCRADIGIILLDGRMKVRFWNQYIQKISGIPYPDAIGRKISEICPAFSEKMMQGILRNALEKGQCRFCSSRLHRAFVYPSGQAPAGEATAGIYQNLKVEPIEADGGVYVLLQIEDITKRVDSELKLTTLISELQRGYQEVMRREEHSRRIAHTDALTGLLNRPAVTGRIDALFSRGGQQGAGALLFIDIDGFKQVNDRCGHQAGDVLLVAFAQRLRAHTRSGDVVARLGGDEFLVLLTDVKTERDAAAVADKLVRSAREPLSAQGREFRITASIGVAMAAEGVGTTDELIRRADMAMYEAKKSGKNTFALYR